MTPLSNAAGAFSIPVNNFNNELGFGLGKTSHKVTRQALEVLKGFDESNFPRGYGEKNDFSMRAKQAGFINIIDNSFIFHTRSASFGPDKSDWWRKGAGA